MEIEVESLGEPENEEKHISKLICDCRSPVRIGYPFGGLLVGHEPKALEELAGFGSNTYRKVLGSMKLVPVSRFTESANSALQFLDSGG